MNQWGHDRALHPQAESGPRPKRHDDRCTLNGILFVLKTGCTWENVPRAYVSSATRWRRFRAWSADGTWERELAELHNCLTRVE